jgi:malonyl CoA-acyl carrier protein transacylase/phosphopantetheinyl transferase
VAPKQTVIPRAELPVRHWETEVVLVKAGNRGELLKSIDAVAAFTKQNPSIELVDLAYAINIGARTEGSDSPDAKHLGVCAVTPPSPPAPLPSCRKRLAGEGRTACLGIVAGSVAELLAKLESAAGRLADPRCREINDSLGVYYFDEPLYPSGRLVFLFPGEGAQYLNMLSDVREAFPECRGHFNACDRLSLTAGNRREPLSKCIFPDAGASDEELKSAEMELAKLHNSAASVMMANWALHIVLQQLGVKADATAGHSSGETSALAAAGCIDADQRLLVELFEAGRVLQQAENEGDMADAGLLAVAAGRDQVTQWLSDCTGTMISMDNCPHQTVVGGPALAIDALEQRLTSQGTICQRLPFNRPYHTPMFQPYMAPIERMYEAIEFRSPRIPVYSCATAKPMPDDPAEIRRLAAAQWTTSVEFRAMIEAMHDDGARLFVEVGPRGNLRSFVQDILRGRQFLAVAADVPTRSGITQLNHLAAQLAAHGVPMQLGFLYRGREPSKSLNMQYVAQDDAFSGRRHGGHRPTIAAMPAMAKQQETVQRETVISRYMDVMTEFLKVQEETHRRFFQQAKSQRAPIKADLTYARSAAAAVARADLPVLRQPWFEGLGATTNLRSVPSSPSSVGNTVGQANRGTHQSTIDKALEPTSHATPNKHVGPMIGEILGHEPGKSLLIRRRVELDEDLYALDHTLGGRRASQFDPNHNGLAVMPMAFNLEMMAEVASLLMPGKVVVGFQGVRLQRWIPLYEEPVEIEVRARVVESTPLGMPSKTTSAFVQSTRPHPLPLSQGERGVIIAQTLNVHIEIRDLGNAVHPGRFDSPSVEGTVLLDDAYPVAPPGDDLPLTNARPCPIGRHELYGQPRRLFHGPRFEVVGDVGLMGDEGVEGELLTLSHSGLFRSTAKPALLTDPLLIDGSTHVLGCWHLAQEDQSGRVVFPYELGSVQLFGPPPAEGTRMKCRVRIEQSSPRRVSHRIDIISPDGRLWCRLCPAEYWRFYWPAECVAFFRRHDEFMASREWPIFRELEDEISHSPAGESNEAFQQPPFCIRRFISSESPDIVQPVIRAALARVALGPAEWKQFYNLQGPDQRRTEWLFGRVAAKDCTRHLWHRRFGKRLFPADIEIAADSFGRPMASHPGIDGKLPCISIAHSAGVCAAIAAFDRRVGIDLERVEKRGANFEEIAFDRLERELLDVFDPDRDEAVARFWCAKEALCKALGTGMIDGPRTAVVRAADRHGGTLKLAIGAGLESSYPELKSARLTVWTKRENDFIVAITFAEKDVSS